MKSTAFAGIAIGLALFYGTVSGVCQSIPAQQEIHFRMVQDTLIVVPVMVNGEGPFDFLLDTGANITALDSSLPFKSALLQVDQVRLSTLAGAQNVNRVRVATFAAGPLQVENFPVLVQDLAALRRMDPKLRGIAGQDFLAHCNYLLDYRRHVLHIEAASEIQDAVKGTRVTISESENRMMVALHAESRSSYGLHLMLDSGANALVMLPAAARALGVVAQASATEATSSGSAGVQLGHVRRITVGSQQFEDLETVLPAVNPSEKIGDGLLPTRLFQSLYVNNVEGFVVFNPEIRRR